MARTPHSTKPKRQPKLPAPKSGKRGRQHYLATPANRALVWAGVAGGIPFEGLAAALGINVDTFKLLFATEIAQAKDTADAKVVGKLYKKAVHEGDTTALIFWCKARLKWRDRDAPASASGAPEVATIAVSADALRQACVEFLAKDSANAGDSDIPIAGDDRS